MLWWKLHLVSLIKENKVKPFQSKYINIEKYQGFSFFVIYPSPNRHHKLCLGAIHTNTVKSGSLSWHTKQKITESPRNPFSIGNVKVSSVALSYTHRTVFKPMPLHLALDRCVSLRFCWSGQVLLNRSFCAPYIQKHMAC